MPLQLFVDNKLPDEFLPLLPEVRVLNADEIVPVNNYGRNNRLSYRKYGCYYSNKLLNLMLCLRKTVPALTITCGSFKISPQSCLYKYRQLWTK
jgi:hypothetical protein